MIVDYVQRQRERRVYWRSADEVFDRTKYDVAPIDRAIARAFVERHHYEHTYPVDRYRFGLYERDELVGVAVFSHPVNEQALACLPGTGLERIELGRLVLLDKVKANAESWFVARCFDALRREGLVSVVSFSDPMERRTLDGSVIMPGHVGTVYQALGGVYLGRSRPERRLLLPDGTYLHGRLMSKIRKREAGYRSGVARMVRAGAAPLGSEDDARAWLARELPRITRAVRHPGSLKYAWALDRRARRHLPASLPYVKIGAPGAIARAGHLSLVMSRHSTAANTDDGVIVHAVDMRAEQFTIANAIEDGVA